MGALSLRRKSPSRRGYLPVDEGHQSGDEGSMDPTGFSGERVSLELDSLEPQSQPSIILTRPSTDLRSESSRQNVLFVATPGGRSGEMTPRNHKRAHFDPSIPKLTYSTFLIAGVAMLWPWNCLLSVSHFFASRFKENKYLRDNYFSYFMLISTATSLVYTFILARRQVGTLYHKRVVTGLVINIVVFAILGLSCVWFTSTPSTIYFIFVIIAVFISAIGTCLIQNGIMAIVNLFGPAYAQAVMVGQAVAGVLPSFALILSMLVFSHGPPPPPPGSPPYPAPPPSPRDVGHRHGPPPHGPPDLNIDPGVMLYFFTATIISFISLALFGALIKKLEHGYGLNANNDNNSVFNNPFQLGNSIENLENYVPFRTLWKKLDKIATSIFFVFCFSLAFPVFASSIYSVNEDLGSLLTTPELFIPIAYLEWNTGDLIGRLVCSFNFFLVESTDKMVLYSIFRAILIPIFFLFNYTHDRNCLIPSDIIYLLLQFVYGFTNGHLCSSAFMKVGDVVEEDEKKAAGSFTTFFLNLGLTGGSLFSFAIAAMVSGIKSD